MKRIIWIATDVSCESANEPRLLMTLGYAAQPARFTAIPVSLHVQFLNQDKGLNTSPTNKDDLPRPSQTHNQLVLVDTVAVFVTLELVTVLAHEAHHVVCGNSTLLNVLARGVKACICGLSKTRLKREQRRLCHTANTMLAVVLTNTHMTFICSVSTGKLPTTERRRGHTRNW